LRKVSHRKRQLSKRWKNFRPGGGHRARSIGGFHPTAFIPGITGRLYQQFAVTIAISVILSGIHALTLSRTRGTVAAAQNRERDF